MYDFTAKLGDTVYCGYDIYFQSVTIPFVVEDTALMNFEGEPRKVLRVNYQTCFPNDHWFTMTWIEGIGSTIHPCYSLISTCGITETDYELACYFEDAQLKFMDSTRTDCESVGIEEQEKKACVNVYPNPVIRVLNISSQGLANKKVGIEVYSASGKLMLKSMTTLPAEVEMSAFAPGVYILKYNTRDEVFTTRIVKNRTE